MRIGTRFQFIAVGLAALATGSFMPVKADTQEPSSETASATSSDPELSGRQLRREERRQQRQERREQSREAPSDQAETAASEEAENQGAFVVYVEPEIECRTVEVSGSRIPKRVCTEVARQAATEEYQEEQAREFLRRLQERALINPPDPNDQEQNSARLPGF